MEQRLILPINQMRITAAYKNSNYKKQFGYTHYGVDCTDKSRSDKTIWGRGIQLKYQSGLNLLFNVALQLFIYF